MGHFRWSAIAIVCLFAAVVLRAQPATVVAISIEGIINPMTSSYLDRTIQEAQELNAECIVLRLDTPGGLDRSMRRMIEAILNSPIPVVVYVAPSGARAASAGVFITLAAHVAAMAPGTQLGAAHPVSIGGGGMDSVMAEKVTNDAAATVRTIAQARKRNVRWAEDAVRYSVSLTDREALDSNVIEIIASDLHELLGQLRGRTVTTVQGEHTFVLDNPRIEEIEMTVVEKFLHTITDPNIAALFLSLGFLAIVIEFYTPGSFGPGIVGTILLIFGFMATESLPINWAGILLLLLAAILLVVELYTPGIGVFAIGSGLAFVIGALILFSPPVPPSPSMPDVRVSSWLVALIAALFVGVGTFVARVAVQVQRRRPRSGIEQLIGAEGVATSSLSPLGTVLVRSERWSAENVGIEPVAAGDRIVVVGYDGAILRVRRAGEIPPS